jgi:hypothetical protein
MSARKRIWNAQGTVHMMGRKERDAIQIAIAKTRENEFSI